MRRTLLFPALALLASCDAPASALIPEGEAVLTLPASSEWVKDTVPLHGHPAMGDGFTPDTVFPFHIYWHRNGVPPRIRAGVRRAVALWGFHRQSHRGAAVVFDSGLSILFDALRQALHCTRLARATAGTLRLKLLRIGVRLTVSVRRVKVAMDSAHPSAAAFARVHACLPAQSPSASRSPSQHHVPRDQCVLELARHDLRPPLLKHPLPSCASDG